MRRTIVRMFRAEELNLLLDVIDDRLELLSYQIGDAHGADDTADMQKLVMSLTAVAKRLAPKDSFYHRLAPKDGAK